MKNLTKTGKSRPSCISQCIDGFRKFFGIYDWDKDRRRNSTILLMMLIMSALLAVIQVILAIVLDFENLLHKFLLNIPFLAIALLCFVMVIVFKFTQTFQITGNVSLIFAIIVIIVFHFAIPGKAGIILSDLIINWSMPVLVISFVVELKCRFIMMIGIAIGVLALWIFEYVKGTEYLYV